MTRTVTITRTAEGFDLEMSWPGRDGARRSYERKRTEADAVQTLGRWKVGDPAKAIAQAKAAGTWRGLV